MSSSNVPLATERESSARQPLYEVVRERLRQQCLSFGGDGMLPPLRQLSANLSVNHLTVSRALKDLESDGIVEIIPRKGIYVRGQAAPTVEILTFLTPNQDLAEISVQMFRGMRETTGAGRVTGTTLNVPPFPNVDEFVANLKARGTAAAVLLGFGYLTEGDHVEEASFIHELSQRIPLVVVGKEHPLLRLNAVYCDARPRLREFLEDCYARGRRRFAYLGSDSQMPHMSHLRQRFECFQEFLLEKGIAWDRKYLPADEKSTGATAARLLDLDPAPEVVIATNLSRAFSLVLEAQSRGLDLRRDLDVLCFASSRAEAHSIAPYVKVVLLNEAAVGGMAMRRLQEMLKNRSDSTVETRTVEAHFLKGHVLEA